MRTAAAVAVALAMVVGGCGREEPESDRGDVAPAAWAGTVCTALRPWRDQIDALMTKAQQRMDKAADAEQAKTGLLELLGGAEAASEAARAKVAAAGLPDASDGRRAAGEFTDSLRRTRDAYGKARAAVQSLPTANPKSFYDGVATAFGQLDKDYNEGSIHLDQVESPELRKAFAEVPACS